jgi:hypothetical protein
MDKKMLVNTKLKIKNDLTGYFKNKQKARVKMGSK